MRKFLVLLAATALLAACGQSDDVGGASAPNTAPTETAEEFVARINAEYKVWAREYNAANWVSQTYINEDSGVVIALANERFAAWHTAAVEAAKAYERRLRCRQILSQRRRLPER